MAIPPCCKVRAREFDLKRTLESGQVFHAMPVGKGWQVLADRTPFYIEQDGEWLLVEEGREELIARYFSFDHPLEVIYEEFPKDSFSTAALHSCRGLRIIRQPRWECVGTFITSPMKQVSHIRQISLTLRERYGKKVPGSLINAYPTPDALAALKEEDLRDCKLGFRAKGLLGTARAVAEETIDLEAIASLPTPEVRKALCTLPGVGRKVANCILLFAYERLDAVPVDVWIGRILLAMRKRKGSNLTLEKYSARKFGIYAGYVQQYLFHHARITKTLPAA
ncbi:N-glycosylase/DNA lyase [Terrimicrobium sacchariphilum]|uniref:DNA-(apurinic or apyrimidinic site) lyase n=1 Tax=Terrimicrobium sacchariphilum TaxID=690879 RepID=A0A146G5U0_TERSA|nr:DNA glycosylase [Terrimicrobium sacchariphilum]GAT33139.1 N-glycosylase/DNA lyase [Terrimicrobium sacchariphilum]